MPTSAIACLVRRTGPWITAGESGIRVHVVVKHVLSSNALLIKQTEQVVHGIRIGNDSVLANSHSLIRMLQRDFAPLDLHSQHESFERIKLFGQHSRVSYMPNQDIN